MRHTWVNGELVQDDTTAGLIFLPAQFVADRSQHFTLETGDDAEWRARCEARDVR